MLPVKPEDVQTIDVVGKVRIAKDRFRDRVAASEDTVALADPFTPRTSSGF